MSIINSQPRIGAAGQSTGYKIERSLRFNSADSAYLNRTPASAGNRKTFTWSGWVKRSVLATASHSLFGSGTSGTDYCFLYFQNDDKLVFYNYSSAGIFPIRSTPLYRDVSAWYHIVLAVDTTQATSSNRVKLWVNNEQITAFSEATYPNQNSDLVINSTSAHAVGAFLTGSPSGYYNGYMTEINFIDGSALTPSSFGETDTDTGVWKPKAYSGSYGTNGFYLKFADNSGTTSTTLGKDSSGNGNNWTPNNFSVTAGAGNDSLVDTPTPYGTDTGAGGEVRGNYATLNPLKINTAANNQFSNGNLNYTVGAYDVSVVSTIGVSTGKWYWEVQWTQDGGFDRPGIVPEDASTSATPTNNGIVWNRLSTTNGMVMLGNNVSGSWGSAFSVNDIIMFALDCDNNALYIGQNGTWRNSGSPTSGSSKTGAVDYSSTSLNGKTLFPVFGKGNAGTTSYIANFGQRPFAYTAPSGFKALCTQNLPTPTIGATATSRANKYFDIVTYTGTGSSNSITGYGFQPDLVWIKSTVSSFDHAWYDAVRGVQKQLESNNTDAETTETTGLTSFNSGGFTVGTSTQVNTATTYISWAWKANGAGSSNTAGSITSTVSANTTAGFSIVTYSSSGNVAATVGHGLNAVPQMIIGKFRDTGSNWSVYHVSVGNTARLTLNTTASTETDSSFWNNTTPTSTVFSVGNNFNQPTTYSYVFYCFAPVAGYSAFGSYTGNGSSDGPFIYTGFRPRWTLFKRSDAIGTWVLYDTKRNSYNIVNDEAYPASNSGFGTADRLDILSNGFKMRNTISELNANGGTYVYACFAENPFKYSLAR